VTQTVKLSIVIMKVTNGKICANLGIDRTVSRARNVHKAKGYKVKKHEVKDYEVDYEFKQNHVKENELKKCKVKVKGYSVK
jgi:hypothetical protein